MSSSLELVVTKGPRKGEIVSFAGGSAVTIGSAPGNTLVLDDTGVAPQHARIDVSFGGPVLKELGSRNGTYVDRARVFGTKKLAPGSEVRLGSTVFEVREQRAAVRGPGDAAREVVLSLSANAAEANLTRAQRNLAVLHQVGELLSTERDARQFLGRMMKLVFHVLKADRGVLLLINADGELTPSITRNSMQAGDAEINVSRTILAKVLDGKSVLTADAAADPQLAPGRKSIMAQSIRSAMCVPIRSRMRCLGAIYVDTVMTVGVFTKDDLEMLSIVGGLAGTALDNLELVKENVQRERMAAIGMVVAGLGHDVRNMLTSLSCGVQLLGKALEDPGHDGLAAAWNVVDQSQQSIGAMVNDMLAYSKPRDPEWDLGDFNAVVRSAIALARPLAAGTNVVLRESLDPAAGRFFFDVRSLERCVMNLLTNAIDAVADATGTVDIRSEVDAGERTVRLVVTDDGHGIAPESRDKVFDLLYSTKGQRGTGFGLAITKKLVEEHGGRVGVESEVGEGASFTIEIPIRRDHPALAEPAGGVNFGTGAPTLVASRIRAPG